MKVRRFARREERSIVGRALGWVLALALLYVVLVLPDRIEDFDAGARWLMPLELPLIVLALALFTGGLRILVRVLITVALTLLLLFKLANMAAYFGFARPFSPFVDALMIPTLLDTVGKAAGKGAAIVAIVGLVLVLLALLGVLSWATGVIVRGIPRHYRAAGVAASLAAAALYFTPYATFNTSRFVQTETVRVQQSVVSAEKFRAALTTEDPLSPLLNDNLFSLIKKKDVLLVFVEAYGRASLDSPVYGSKVRAELNEFEAALKDKGFASRSSWIKSPTFGGESYLAHSTVLSGFWINDQERYAQLLHSGRKTLAHDFTNGGWRTVGVMPEITMAWPEGDYYGFDKIMTAPNLGYKGRSFEYMTMPDQYTLSAFQRAELAPTERKPVMATIALVSSHIPWAPIPKLVPWEEVGDGTVFNEARTPESADEVWRTPARIPQFYADSIVYSLQALQSFVTTYGTDDMLIIIVGDHQPMTFIAGEGASFETPIHIIARDPSVLTRIDEGSGAEGMAPDANDHGWDMAGLRTSLILAFTPRLDESSSPDSSNSTPVASPSSP